MKKLAAVCVAFIITALSVGSVASLAEAPKLVEPLSEARTTAVAPRLNPLLEFAKVPIPTVAWVMAKAQCETGTDWAHKGTYGGAWGFMHRGYETDASGLPSNSTWGRWGGFRYAKHPSRATPTQQVIIYLRVNWGGWHRPNGMYRPPSSSQDTANNCYKFANRVAGRIKLQVRNLDKWYANFALITYLRAVATSRS